MDQHEPWLKEWIQNGILDGVQQHDPKLWRNQVIGQCMSWINGGLRPRAMTRDLDWGVKVPLPNADGKVLYVWLDAPIGYISATKQWALDKGKDWRYYWTKSEAGDRKLVHFIGKDNIVFHAIIFPILLKDHGDFILPDNVPAYEFLNLEGDKFSTSRNWAVWLHEYLEAYPDKVDELKYVLTAIAPESKDSEFTWKEFQTRINSELADIYGNFVNRTLVLTHKYYEGIVPSPLAFCAEDQAVFDAIEQAPRRIAELMYAYKIREAQTEMMQIARIGNKYLADQEPWKAIKTDPERVQTILYVALQITANLQIATQIFLPATAQKLGKMLNAESLPWSSFGSSTLLAAGHQIGEAHILFTKIEDELVQSEVEKLQASNQLTSPYPPMKDLINFDDFSKMDMRMGKILEAEKVENADKLLKLKVHTGIDERTIVSGIAAHYAPEDIIGKTVLVLLNLAPRKIRGIESQGMILMAENAEGTLSFLASEKDFGEGPTVA
jgi:methionyl-tRNA synthetase